jgi:hypothetical protein
MDSAQTLYGFGTDFLQTQYGHGMDSVRIRNGLGMVRLCEPSEFLLLTFSEMSTQAMPLWIAVKLIQAKLTCSIREPKKDVLNVIESLRKVCQK